MKQELQKIASWGQFIGQQLPQLILPQGFDQARLVTDQQVVAQEAKGEQCPGTEQDRARRAAPRVGT